ncbi:MAG: SUMF1/EgtB/PvdO family nonheme iron enzyme [Planctomycetota bacterium]|nr:SUMF1/EgtB/PvdO family nonheme iron enzyme [Planctomycetota bacterium]
MPIRSRVLASAVVVALAPWAGAQPAPWSPDSRVVPELVVVPVLSPANQPVGGFCIGAYETTNEQYAAYLNSVGASDPRGIYDDKMASTPEGGIVRTGAPGAFTYACKPGMERMPVLYLTWMDAVRYVNWLNNGRPVGASGTPETTEDGAYTLAEDDGQSYFWIERRNTDARWFLPNWGEWRRAGRLDASTGTMWDWPTHPSAEPLPAIGATVTGELLIPGPNAANFGRAANWNGTVDGNVVRVGSAGARSPNGTFDQIGNVWEWVEDLKIIAYGSAHAREAWGGAYSTRISASPSPSALSRSWGAVRDEPNVTFFGWLHGFPGVRVARLCPADVDASGRIDADDVASFVQAFQAGETRADADDSGFIDSDDAVFFLERYSTGC